MNFLQLTALSSPLFIIPVRVMRLFQINYPSACTEIFLILIAFMDIIPFRVLVIEPAVILHN